MDNLKFTIPGKPEYMTMIRLATSSIASEAGFDLDATEDIKAAVTEACKTVSCHGNEGFSDKYEIEFAVDPGTIEITVIDACEKHALEKMSEHCANCPQENDISMVMLRSLMNCVKVGQDEEGHKFINMVKRA
ncbi:MAG: ATP-binding protein [Firmicutes bacterium]|nr:ATP-binding protein [Bacillota bacterium]